MKVETDPSLTVANLADALLKHESPQNERKVKRSRTEKLRFEDIKAAMHKAEDLTAACPKFKLFG
jgi:hypothetical protein